MIKPILRKCALDGSINQGLEWFDHVPQELVRQPPVSLKKPIISYNEDVQLPEIVSK